MAQYALDKAPPINVGGWGTTPTPAPYTESNNMSKGKHRAYGRPYPLRYELNYYKHLYWQHVRPAIRNVIRKLF